jgi:hypothetical protein
VGYRCDESGQEVLTVLSNYQERPSALVAARARVLIPPVPPAAAAHGLVGSSAGAGVVGVGTTLVRTQAPKNRVQGTSVPSVKRFVIGMAPVYGARGKPPRGRPV